MLSFLLDTNTFIPMAPTRDIDIEDNSATAADFRRLASRLEAHLLLHPLSIEELNKDRNAERRRARQQHSRGFETLNSPPSSTIIDKALGLAPPTSNDWVDHHMLTAVYSDAVHYLVTDDTRIHKKAKRLDLDPDRVLTLPEATAFLSTLLNESVSTPPNVRERYIHELDKSDPIFVSLREDYPSFDNWLATISRQQRQAWTIDVEGSIAGLCIWKPQDDEYGLGGKVLKVSTFKVAEFQRSNRYGELLLKSLFLYLHANAYDWVWLTIFPKHDDLIELLRSFGFDVLPNRQTALGELVMAKPLRPIEESAMEPLEFHRKFGPPAISLVHSNVFVIPIEPQFHRMLFPDYEQSFGQMREFPLSVPRPPFANGLRKAYLSRSSVRSLPVGATLLFYRSEDARAVTAVGVAEASIRSREPREIAQFTSLRTVYSLSEIQGMVDRDVLAIRFRQDRLLERPIGYRELREAGVLKGRPQSITEIQKQEAKEWLARRIGE